MSTLQLGDLTRRRPENDASFGWYDATVRVHPRATNLLLNHFLDQASRIPDADIAGSMKLMNDFFRKLVHPEDFETFWDLALDNGLQVQDLLAMSWVIVERLAARPTGARPASSGTPRRTQRKSKGGSSLPGIVRRMERNGRPDLGLAILRAQASIVSSDAQRTG